MNLEQERKKTVVLVFAPLAGWVLAVVALGMLLGKEDEALIATGLILGGIHGGWLGFRQSRRMTRYRTETLERVAARLGGFRVARDRLHGQGLVGEFKGIPLRVFYRYHDKRKRWELWVVVVEGLLVVTITPGDGDHAGSLPGFDGFLDGTGDTQPLLAQLDAEGRALLYAAVVEREWTLVEGCLNASAVPVMWDETEIIELLEETVALARQLRADP